MKKLQKFKLFTLAILFFGTISSASAFTATVVVHNETGHDMKIYEHTWGKNKADKTKISIHNGKSHTFKNHYSSKFFRQIAFSLKCTFPDSTWEEKAKIKVVGNYNYSHCRLSYYHGWEINYGNGWKLILTPHPLDYTVSNGSKISLYCRSCPVIINKGNL
ncbi:MAG: hypothetical protein K9M56_06830 [Victivallales bacterium]|nr:hypothetical protein [Victivallales bacterium]